MPTMGSQRAFAFEFVLPFTFVFGAGFGYLNVTGKLNFAELTTFNSCIITIGFAMGQFAAAVAKVFEGMGASGRVFYLLIEFR